MSRWYRTGVVVVAVCACVLAANWAAAQPPNRARGGGMGGMMGGGMMSAALLRSPQVQQELRLTDDQKAKMQEAGQQMMGDFADLQNADPAERAKKMEEVQKSISDKLNAILTPEQTKRLKEISLQVQGAAALLDPEVSQQLGITEDQKQQLQDLQEKMKGQFGELRNAAPEQRQAKFQQLRRDAEADAMNILTPPQRDKFEQMKGAKVDIDLSSLMGGGRGPGGPGRPGGQP